MDGIIVAGDLIRGPDDNEVIQLLQTLPCWAIRGNTDNSAILSADNKTSDNRFSLKQYAALRWCLERLSPESLEYLQSLPEQRVVEFPGTDSIRVVHGSPRDPNELLYPEQNPETLETAFTQTLESVLICVHTHLAWQRKRDGRLALNPGSVGLPVSGIPHAHYAILHWQTGEWIAEQRLIEYDLNLVRKRFIDSGYLDAGGAFARALLHSAITGKQILGQFLKHTRQVALKAGVINLNSIPDDVWDLVDDTFEWGV